MLHQPTSLIQRFYHRRRNANSFKLFFAWCNFILKVMKLFYFSYILSKFNEFFLIVDKFWMMRFNFKWNCYFKFLKLWNILANSWNLINQWVIIVQSLTLKLRKLEGLLISIGLRVFVKYKERKIVKFLNPNIIFFHCFGPIFLLLLLILSSCYCSLY